jgi:hypothetical protein
MRSANGGLYKLGWFENRSLQILCVCLSSYIFHHSTEKGETNVGVRRCRKGIKDRRSFTEGAEEFWQIA